MTEGLGENAIASAQRPRVQSTGRPLNDVTPNESQTSPSTVFPRKYPADQNIRADSALHSITLRRDAPRMVYLVQKPRAFNLPFQAQTHMGLLRQDWASD